MSKDAERLLEDEAWLLATAKKAQAQAEGFEAAITYLQGRVRDAKTLELDCYSRLKAARRG